MAILVSVSVLASAGPAGPASAEEGADSGADSEVSTMLLPGELEDVGVYFHVGSGLTLGKPTELANRYTIPFERFIDVGNKGAGYKFRMTRTYSYFLRSEMVVSWPILEGRTGWSDTGYRVISTIKGMTPNSGWVEECRIDDPRGLGGTYFHCNQVRRGLSFNWDLNITDDRLDREAEASGAIRTRGSVSLFGGQTYSESKLQVIGAEAVGENESTQFDAVLRSSDHEGGREMKHPDTARVDFQYAVNDGGQPVYSKKNGRQLFVRGYVSNKRTDPMFVGGAWCEFITGQDDVEEDSGYTCDPWWGDYANTGIKNGHVHYIANFEVRKNE
jgi:hypothetical protein